jgi:hypothetical protein
MTKSYIHKYVLKRRNYCNTIFNILFLALHGGCKTNIQKYFFINFLRFCIKKVLNCPHNRYDLVP